ncbi:unnamed protein product [Discosporangium mesarthrocarpum]
MTMASIVEAARYILLMQWPYAAEVCVTVHVLISCVNIRLADKKREWNVVMGICLVLVTAFGGGIMAPMLLGKPPVFLTNDLLVPLVAILYLITIRFDPYVVKAVRTRGVFQILILVDLISRINAVVLFVDKGAAAIPPSKYYPVAFFGPIIMGTIRGTGGLFVPFDKGLSTLSAGLSWNIQQVVACATFYHLAVNDMFLLGGFFRGTLYLGDITPPDAKALAVGFAVGVTGYKIFTGHSEFNPFTVPYKFANALVGMAGLRAGSSSSPMVGAGNGGNGVEGNDGHKLYNLEDRRKTQRTLEVLKVVGAFLVVLLAAYEMEPSSSLVPGQSLKPGEVLASCTFLSPLRPGCEPHGSMLTETGSLVVFKGRKPPAEGAAAGGGGHITGEVLWSSPSPEVVQGGDLSLTLSEDGKLMIVAGGKTVWSSTLSAAGKRSLNYRVGAHLEAKDGSLNVYKGGDIVWSSKTTDK